MELREARAANIQTSGCYCVADVVRDMAMDVHRAVTTGGVSSHTHSAGLLSPGSWLHKRFSSLASVDTDQCTGKGWCAPVAQDTLEDVRGHQGVSGSAAVQPAHTPTKVD